jgi:phosphoenolpyruvate carboxykinase (ATP)
MSFDLKKQGISASKIHRNRSVARLFKGAMARDEYIPSDAGAMIAKSGVKTGRSPGDKRVVEESDSKEDVWWGKVNIPLSEDSFGRIKQEALEFLNGCEDIFVVDGFAGWDPKYKIKVRIICSREYHALFMHNMLIRPTEDELASYGDPDWVVYNAGVALASEGIEGLTSQTCSGLNLKSQEMVIIGSEYAGEMKKGIFTVLNYTLPKQGVLSMHCSANEGSGGDTALFFGLSGTGKTTLSADPNRNLIGDDEHGWSEDGIFNFEGGCYAKTIDLSEEKEPEIFRAIRFGSVLENVVYDPETYKVDYSDGSITENTRCSYPVEYIDNAKIPCVGGHPDNIVFLTCDAFGVLPPVSKLTRGQAMYHFISGYTAKVAGTEVGVTEPEATFSACFGAAFLVWHPTKYAEMLAEMIDRHGSTVWLVNTGWSGGAYGVGERFPLKHTRAIIDAVLDNSMRSAEFDTLDIFGLEIPKVVNHVPPEILNPRTTWADKNAYDSTASKLAAMFVENFKKYADRATAEILDAAPQVPAKS